MPVVAHDGSFETELASLRPLLLRWARRLTQDLDDAEDLVQDALEMALRKQQLFRSGTRLAAWVGRIQRNLYFDRCRRPNRERPGTDMEVPAEAAGVCEPQVTETVPPWDWADADHLRAALRSARTEFAQVVELHDLQGRSRTQVAQAVGCPPATVGTRLHRGRKVLRDQLAALDVPLSSLRLEYTIRQAA